MNRKEVMEIVQELDNNYCSEIELLHSNLKGLMQVCEAQAEVIKRHREEIQKLQIQIAKLLEVDRATNARIDLLEDMFDQIVKK